MVEKSIKNNKIKKGQFLVSITTTKGADWEARIKEIDKLKIKKLALFVTCVNEKERKKLYQALEKTSLKEIPFFLISFLVFYTNFPNTLFYSCSKFSYSFNYFFNFVIF